MLVLEAVEVEVEVGVSTEVKDAFSRLCCALALGAIQQEKKHTERKKSSHSVNTVNCNGFVS